MRKFIPFAFFSLIFTACTPLTSPAEQVQEAVVEQTATAQPAKPTSNVKNRAVQYQCKQKKSVKITKSANKKNQSIRVEFNQVSHRLSPVVTRSNSKKYSNIRWIWTEDYKGVGKLQNKAGKVLAEKCVKK